MAKAKDKVIVMMPLEVKLTEKELKNAGKFLAEAINKKAAIEHDIEAYKAQKKAELAVIDADISKNTILVNSEKEFRRVECEVEYDFEVGRKTYARLDTGEIVKTDTISNEERQQMLPAIKPVADRKQKAAGE